MEQELCELTFINVYGTNKKAGRTVGVLSDVKLSQNHNRFFSKVSASCIIRGVYGVLEAAIATINLIIMVLSCSFSPLVHPQHASTPSKLVVFTSVEYLTDAQLTQSGRAHDARLDGHVERRVREGIARS